MNEDVARGRSSTQAIFDAAATVLRANSRGATTIAAPGLYPHQWSWDAAFVAVGLARLSVSRAITELCSLLRAQWRTGMIPHIVYSDEEGYFPGPARWRTARAKAAPDGVATSGICQPPVHSIALYRIVTAARRAGGTEREAAEDFLADTFDSWLAWHRWLAEVRDPIGCGMVEIHHSWESGMDNSPRWDEPYTAVQPGAMEPFTRRDTHHVADAAERPSDRDYNRYLWLVEQMARAEYDDAAVRASVDFRVGDVFSSALLSHSSELLATLAEGLGRGEAAAELQQIAARSARAVRDTVSPATGLACDRNARTGQWLSTPTIAGFAPLLCDPAEEMRGPLRAALLGADWCGHPGMRHAVPPTTSPSSSSFSPRTYWRGPQWPVITWLFSWTAGYHGDTELARVLRDRALDQLADGVFAEYYDPLSGDPLGSAGQSWTAAVALDWSAETAA